MQVSDFNCTRYAGVCKPTTVAALGIVQEAQRQLNRVAQLKGLTKITVDGDVGPKMLALAQKAMGTTAKTAQELALGVDVLSVLAATTATANGVPQQVAQPKPIVQPTIIPPGAPSPIAVPQAGGFLPPIGGLSQTQMLVVGGVIALIAYKKFFKKGRRK